MNTVPPPRSPHTAVGPDSTSSFFDNRNGTVTDTRTGLMWMRAAEGQEWREESSCAVGQPKLFTWACAMTIRRNFQGYDDWRLPTADELKSIVDLTQFCPTINSLAFPGFDKTRILFWTSTTCGVNVAMYISFYGGSSFVGQSTSENAVRLVRYAKYSESEGTRHPPTPRFIDNGDGTVEDTKTALTWMRFTEGQSWSETGIKGEARTFTWRGAEAQRRSFAGHADWRLPSITELRTIVEKDVEQPLINSVVFPSTTRFLYWSSSVTDSPGQYWGVDFLDGRSEPYREFDALCVRLVRGELDLQIVNADTGFGAVTLESFELRVTRNGLGSGIVTCTPEGPNHPSHTTVTLAATPEYGSMFDGWAGDVAEKGPVCTVIMDSAKAVTANFSRLSFILDVTTTGSGTGTVTRSLEANNYYYASIVTLTACAAEGSIFLGWSGDATGLDAANTVTIDSAKSVTAEFARLDIPDLALGIAFDSAEHTRMKSGDDAFIFYFSIENKGQKQIRIELPLSSYVTCHREEIEQDAWLSGLINGSQGSTIRAGAYRKIGLVFFKSKVNGISTGDHLYISVIQTKQSRRFNFTFRCTNGKSLAFTLINANAGDEHAPEAAITSSPETAGILQRIELLETRLSDALREIQALQAVPPASTEDTGNRAGPTKTLLQVLNWLTTQERISVAHLRSHLLPLDLLPSAVIDDINERALDLTGEPALEDNGEEFVLVARGVLAEVLAHWEVVIVPE